MRRLIFGVLLLTAAQSVRGQTVAGRVLDVGTLVPVAGATATLVDGREVVASGRTSDSGSFEIRAPKAGSFTLRLARLGYEGISTDVKVESGGRTTSVYRLTRLPATLDPVTAAGRGNAPAVTLGRDMFRRHLLANRGQMVTGLEIQKSKLLLSEYLGMLPGLRLVPTVSPPAPGQSTTVSPPTIPGRDVYLLPTSDEHCLYGRIDHWSVIGLLDHGHVANIDELLSPADVMGVEVYKSYQDIPNEWRGAALVQQLIWRTGFGGRNYLIGDTGLPAYPRYTIRANLRDPIVNDVTPFEVQSLRAPGVSSNVPVTATVVGYTHNSAHPSDSTPFFKGGVPIDTVEPPSFALPTMDVPQCGFVQIWTHLSW